MVEIIMLYSKAVSHWATAKVCMQFPSKAEDACIHLLEAGINAKKCARILGEKAIEAKADWVIDTMSQMIGI